MMVTMVMILPSQDGDNDDHDDDDNNDVGNDGNDYTCRSIMAECGQQSRTDAQTDQQR